ncbi:MAG: Gfo/Idh/MocA family protein [Coriobacteriales bacterium]|jgi:alpha-N-acetylgalactosaminidase
MKDKKLKIGVIGLGQRGAAYGMTDGSIGLLGNILNNSDVLVTALCDLHAERVEFAAEKVIKAGQGEPLKTTDFSEVLRSGVDAVIVSTSWASHVEVALAAMEQGIAVGIEVGGTHNLDDMRKLVQSYEKTKTPFMFLENCCYNKDELLATSLTRNGKLGEICYCHGAYCHDLRNEITEVALRQGHYRLEEYKNHNCENYPTHELGPIVKLLGITRGNKFTYLTAMASKARGLNEYIDSHQEVSVLKGTEFKQGDVVTTAIKCENGELITLKLDTTLPRLYDREITVSGTKGYYSQTLKAVILDGDKFDHEKNVIQDALNSQNDYEEYLPEDWKTITEEQLKSGHGGMDYIMLKHFFRAVKNKDEMPIDVYEACAMMCVTALSEQSIKNNGAPVEVPDFTDGNYKNRQIVDVLPFPKIR